MATKKRAGLGRGISSLIPTATERRDRPVDVFFGSQTEAGERSDATQASTKADATKQTEQSTSSTSTSPKASAPTSSSTSTAGGTASAASKSSGGKTTSGSGSNRSKGTSTKSTAPKSSAGGRSSTAGSRSTAKASSGGNGTASSEPATTTSSTRRTRTAAAAGAAPSNAPVAEPADTTPDETSIGQGEAPEQDLVPVPGATLRHVEPALVVPNAWQPRHEFEEDALDELIHSVREFGVLQPIVVRPIPDDHPLAGEASYELIMGERRLRASKAAGLESIPAIVKETPDDAMLRDALLENLHRSQLNPLEEASAYAQLLDDFGITQEELAQRIGRSRPQVSNTLRLLKLPVDVQRRVAAGVLSAGHARAVLSVGEPAAMTQLADKIINEDLSVRAAEAAAAKSGARTSQPGGEGRAPKAGGLTGYLDEVGERLGDRLNTRVKVTLRRTKGQIVVDFASVADLNRILEELGESPAGE